MVAPKFPKLRYPKVAELANTKCYHFDPTAEGNDWLAEHNNSGSHDIVEHTLEYRFVHEFVGSLGQINSQAAQRLNQKYSTWAGDNVHPSQREHSCYIELQGIIGSKDDSAALCILEQGLNQIKTHIWALKRPIGDKWVGNLSFRHYQNVDNVKNEFCRVASTFAYMTHRNVSLKFRYGAQGIKKALIAFEKAYNKSFGASVDFSSAWEQSLRTHLESMRRKCRQWFIETFESFLNNQSNWEEANPNIHKEIGKKVKELQTVRAQILRAIDRLGKLNDHVFDEMY